MNIEAARIDKNDTDPICVFWGDAECQLTECLLCPEADPDDSSLKLRSVVPSDCPNHGFTGNELLKKLLNGWRCQAHADKLAERSLSGVAVNHSRGIVEGLIFCADELEAAMKGGSND